MTDFKSLKSIPVKTISGDRPGAFPSSFEGQLYYDSDGAGAFKFIGKAGAGAWASGGNLPAGKFARPGGAGTQNAALAWGGGPGNGEKAYSRALYYNHPGIHRNENLQRYGYSVRCIQD